MSNTNQPSDVAVCGAGAVAEFTMGASPYINNTTHEPRLTGDVGLVVLQQFLRN
jgi:hypothetical protein